MVYRYAHSLDKRSLQSLDFTINRFFMKLFKTSDIKVVKDCQIFFNSSCQVHCWLECLIKLSHVVLVRTFSLVLFVISGTDQLLVSLFVFVIVILSLCFFLYKYYLPCW